MSEAPKDRAAYKIIGVEEWAAIEASGVYGGSAVDHADGYIHLSTAEQLIETAAKHYRGRDALMVLTIDLAVLGDTVKWEPSRGGQLFPHIYGPLPVTAVGEKRRFSVDAQGEVVDHGPV